MRQVRIKSDNGRTGSKSKLKTTAAPIADSEEEDNTEENHAGGRAEIVAKGRPIKNRARPAPSNFDESPDKARGEKDRNVPSSSNDNNGPPKQTASKAKIANSATALAAATSENNDEDDASEEEKEPQSHSPTGPTSNKSSDSSIREITPIRLPSKSNLVVDGQKKKAKDRPVQTNEGALAMAPEKASDDRQCNQLTSKKVQKKKADVTASIFVEDEPKAKKARRNQILIPAAKPSGADRTKQSQSNTSLTKKEQKNKDRSRPAKKAQASPSDGSDEANSLAEESFSVEDEPKAKKSRRNQVPIPAAKSSEANRPKQSQSNTSLAKKDQKNKDRSRPAKKAQASPSDEDDGASSLAEEEVTSKSRPAEKDRPIGSDKNSKDKKPNPPKRIRSKTIVVEEEPKKRDRPVRKIATVPNYLVDKATDDEDEPTSKGGEAKTNRLKAKKSPNAKRKKEDISSSRSDVTGDCDDGIRSSSRNLERQAKRKRQK